MAETLSAGANRYGVFHSITSLKLKVGFIRLLGVARNAPTGAGNIICVWLTIPQTQQALLLFGMPTIPMTLLIKLGSSLLMLAIALKPVLRAGVGYDG
jgi:hypothetical protein